MDIRIRPANNNEQQENRKDRSYRVATDQVLTTGVGQRANNFKFSHIYFEPALQHHVLDRVKQSFKSRRNLFMVYGQTGAGKTHTMSGGAWKNNGLIQQYVLDRIKWMKGEAARENNYYSMSVSVTIN